MHRCAPLAAVLMSLATVPSAHADIFATFDTSFPPAQLRTFNLTTGAAVSLPPGVNDTTANQFHPAFTPDGRFMVFERRTLATPAGVRIVMVERSTGRSADLFNAFESAADPPTTPTFSLDGTKVITGRRLDHRDPASPPDELQNSYTETDVTNFPNGPFPHRIVLAGGVNSGAAGRTLQLVPFGAGLLAFGIDYATPGPADRVVVQSSTGATTISDPRRRFANPAISEADGVAVFESAPAVTPFDTKLVFRPLNGVAGAPNTLLPGIVNAFGKSVTNPTFTRGGRYLAFARRNSDNSDNRRLFVWDTVTQLLINTTGVFAGLSVTDGGIALEVRRVLSTTTLGGSLGGFTLTTGSSTGLLVQRIVGRHDVLGHVAPSLRIAGKVPLGTFRAGPHQVHWGFTVNGRHLGRGCYLVTFRALTQRGQVRDLSTPYTVAIHAHHPPLVSRGVRLGAC